jgi:hypothetical protein
MPGMPSFLAGQAEVRSSPASSETANGASPNRWRQDEHGHEDEHAVACAARRRQPRSDPRAGRARDNLKDVSVEVPKRRLTVATVCNREASWRLHPVVVRPGNHAATAAEFSPAAAGATARHRRSSTPYRILDRAASRGVSPRAEGLASCWLLARGACDRDVCDQWEPSCGCDDVLFVVS